LLVWSRVYFYAVIITALSTAFFASSGKKYLISQLNQRNGTIGLRRTQSQESLANREPVLGLPSQPQEDLEELVSEVKAEFETRQRKGSKSTQPVPLSTVKKA
jgi:lysophospholipid acyltransferase